MSPFNISDGVATLTRTEAARYSVINAVLAAMPNSPHKRSLERDASDAEVHRSGRVCQGGIRVPREVLYGLGGSRTMTASDASDGGFTVGGGVRPLFDYVWGQSAVLQFGATFFGGMDDAKGAARPSLGLPVITGGTVAEWVPEGSAPSGNFDPDFGQTVATPHRAVATVRVSTQWLTQTGPQAEANVRRHIAGAISAAIDLASLDGAGGKEPIGLLKKPGVNQVSLGSNGAALTRIKLNEVEDAVVLNRHDITGAAYILSAASREKAKGIQTATGTSGFLVETVNGRDFTNGYQSVATSRMPDTGTKGSGSSLGSLVFGVFPFLEIYTWGGADFIVDPFTRARYGEVEITVDLLADVVTARPEAFTRVVDIVNT